MHVSAANYRRFHTVYHQFFGNLPITDSLRSDCASKMDFIDSSNPRERDVAIRLLGAFCFLEAGNGNDHSRRLLSLFEFYARYSPFEDVRIGCINAIYLMRDLPRLQSVACGMAYYHTSIYSQMLAEHLASELAQKC
jgi:hypothetical protein